MPKSIEPYRKVELLSSTSHNFPSFTSIAIVTVVFLFSLTVCTDALTQMGTESTKMEEQSRLCLIEFKKQDCDSLKTSVKCQ